MSTPAFPPLDADLGSQLRRLQQALADGDEPVQQALLAARGADGWLSAPTLVAALALGGAGLAMRLVALAAPGLGAEDRQARVVDAFAGTLDAPPGAGDHERAVAQWLIDGLGLQADAATLLDLMRAEFLIAEGPMTELPEAVLAAVRLEQWALALRGLQRMRDTLGAGTPRNAYGLAAMCLHKLGRFAEADAWVHEGLGEQARLLSIGPVKTETELMRQWGKHRAPVISIICCTYNHERYIDHAIRGFLAQDCPYPFEILIHDDASTDGTARIVREWQARYPNVIRPTLQTVNQFSRGVRPFELLLAQARGEFVATCEGDDFWTDPNKLRKQVGYLKAHPDVSCSAHNYHHFMESSLTVKPWSALGRDFFLSARQLMSVQLVLWLPTLVFRKSFRQLPPERDLAAIGDQFLTSYLGTQGRCAYFETMTAAVRRENEFSLWSPLSKDEKERRRIRTWAALVRLYERTGQAQAVADLQGRIDASKLPAEAKRRICDEVRVAHEAQAAQGRFEPHARHLEAA